MSQREEPSYIAFARSNVRDGLMSTPSVVRELLARIDRLEAEKPRVWREGWEHYGKYFSPNFPEFGKNPYEKEKS